MSFVAALGDLPAHLLRHAHRSREPQVVALLASVIETGRKRKGLPWPFLADMIAKRRKGEAVPPLPTMVAAQKGSSSHIQMIFLVWNWEGGERLPVLLANK